MKILEPYLEKRSCSLVKCQCDYCDKEFTRLKCALELSIKNNKSGKLYCSTECFISTNRTKKTVICKQCGAEFLKKESQIKKFPNHFCCSSCAAIYNNTHKTKGTRRSKLEQYLEKELPLAYPSLDFKFNQKDAINSELDIYVPSLKLAFELNGIFHYEPIYGAEKLSQIKNNDDRKFQACLEKGISLCVIDSSKQVYFTEKSSKKYLDIICNIINAQH